MDSSQFIRCYNFLFIKKKTFLVLIDYFYNKGILDFMRYVKRIKSEDLVANMINVTLIGCIVDLSGNVLL